MLVHQRIDKPPFSTWKTMFADHHRSPGYPGSPLSGAASTEERLRIGTRPSWGGGAPVHAVTDRGPSGHGLGSMAREISSMKLG